ncbi:MAG: hypothetical protein PHD66_06920 [Eubacteriales bacterium]|nr:hypothetical protein [Eubacteriales bacterium]
MTNNEFNEHMKQLAKSANITDTTNLQNQVIQHYNPQIHALVDQMIELARQINQLSNERNRMYSQMSYIIKGDYEGYAFQSIFDENSMIYKILKEAKGR